MADFEQLRRDVQTFFAALRMSLGQLGGISPSNKIEAERFMQAMLMMEEAKARFTTYARYYNPPDATIWSTLRQDLERFLNDYRRLVATNPSYLEKRFQIRGGSAEDYKNPSEFLLIFADNPTLTVADALSIFGDLIENPGLDFSQADMPPDFGHLAYIIPQQQVAAAQFDVVHNKIVVLHLPSKVSQNSEAAISSALAHIEASGGRLIENLEKSNCDPRLLESVVDLQRQITNQKNIIGIGLTNIACGMMGAKFQTELPDAISAMLLSYSTSVSLYAAQFTDWQRFTRNAASVDFDEIAIKQIDSSAAKILEAIAVRPDLVDPEVPKTIAFARNLLKFPGASAKRAAFALLRTIENLMASILRHGVDFVNKTAEKTVDAASTAGSKIIVGLLGIALVGALAVGPAAVQAGIPWVKQVADVVRKQIEKMSE